MALSIVTAPLASAQIVCLDTLGHVDATTAADLAAAGFTALGRYVNLHEGAGGFAIDAAELDGITASLGCWAIQMARTADWSATTGAADGRAAARNARAAGFPAGACLVCDFEGAIPHNEASAYANAWFDAAELEGHAALAIYIGAGVPLDAQALFHGLRFRRYWRSFSEVPNVAGRGYQLIQLFPDDQEVLGPGRGRFDLNAAQSDYFGDRWTWAVRAA